MKTLAPRIALLLFGPALLRAEAPAGPDSELERQLKSAPKVETEDLCEPVKSVREGMLLRAPNPDGNSWDVIQIYFPSYGGPNTIVVIDTGTGEVKQISTERGWNFHLCPSVLAPNGNLFISALNSRLQQKICVYDPARNELVLDAVKMPEEVLGETHPLVLGTDGKIYAIGQHPSKAATAAQIDPDTRVAIPYGPIGPSHAPSSCWGYSGAADDRFIYIASGKVPWYLVAYDRRTGRSETLIETERVEGMVSVGQQPDGCTASASGIVGTDGARRDYWLHEGKALPRDGAAKSSPPWARRPDPPRKGVPPPEVDTRRAVPDLEGFAEIRIRSPEDRAKATAPPAPGTPPEEAGWKRYRYRVPLYPHEIYRLMELTDGRLFGTAGAYEGNFVFDPVTNLGKHLGKTHLSHYSTAFLGGQLYMSGYPTSPLYVFDPGRPWTAGTIVGNRLIEDKDADANPRQLLLLGTKELAGTHKMYAGVTGADGAVYFGGQWMRDGACGGVAWYDPKAGKAGGMWKPFSNYQVTHMAAADEGRVVVISTRRVDDTVLKKPKPEQGALFLLKTGSREVGGPLEPVPQAKGTGPIACAGGSRIVGWTSDPANEQASILYGVDTRDSKVVYTKALPRPLPVAIGSNQQEAWDFRIGPDGWIWTFIDGVMARIEPSSGEIRVVGRPAKAGRIAFAQNRVYLGGTTALRLLKGVTVPAAK